MEDSVAAVEARVDRLEAFVRGGCGRAGGGPLVARLCQVADKLARVERDRPELAKLYEQMDTLNKLSHLACVDKACLDTDVKWRMVESNADGVFDSADRLQQVDEAKAVLDSEHIRHCGGHDERVALAARRHAALAFAADRLLSDVSRLISTYNHAVMTVNRQFIYWDQLLTKLEMEKGVSGKE